MRDGNLFSPVKKKTNFHFDLTLSGKLYSDTHVFISPELPVTVSSKVELCETGFIIEFEVPDAPGTGRVERKWEGGGASGGS